MIATPARPLLTFDQFTVQDLEDSRSQQPHPQGDGACDSSSHFWADHNRHID
jgi:hypothetical protein